MNFFLRINNIHNLFYRKIYDILFVISTVNSITECRIYISSLLNMYFIFILQLMIIFLEKRLYNNYILLIYLEQFKNEIISKIINLR